MPHSMMPSAEDEPDQLLYLLVDSNVFGRRAWIQSLIDAAQAGYVRLYWSPTIIEEMARMRQLIWMRNRLKEGEVTLTEAIRRRYSVEAHRWMDFIGPHFHVVENKPPFAPAWADPMPDPYDAPIWTAARRADADIIVTQNLRDGPPRNARGLQVFDGVLYLNPEDLVAVLGWWGDLCGAISLEPPEGEQGRPLVTPSSHSAERGTNDAAMPHAVQDFLRETGRRRQERGSDAQP
jgi:hypothetical protein